MASQDIVVIGAGIVGVSSALWLRREGFSVTLLDPDGAGAATSFGNAGLIAVASIVPVPVPGLLLKAPKMLLDPMGPLYLRWRYLPRLLPWLIPYLRHGSDRQCRRIAEGLSFLLNDAVEQHLQLIDGCEAEQWFALTDYLWAYPSRASFEADSYAWELRKAHGVRSEDLEGKVLRDYDPSLGPGIGFGVRCPGHAMIKDPGKYVAALAKQFEVEGGHIKQARVEDFRVNGGRIEAVVADGEALACQKVVIAAGPWSARLTRLLGLKTPLEAERGYHIEIKGSEVMPRVPTMVVSGKFVAAPMAGRLRCAGVVEFAGLDAPESEKPVGMLIQRVKEAYPGLNGTVSSTWMGRRPATIDSLPYIGESEKIEGLYCAFGHQHVGLTAGPKTGRLIAELVAGRRQNRDLTAYRLERFE